MGKWEGKGVSKIVCITLQMYTVNIKGRRGYKIVYACEGGGGGHLMSSTFSFVDRCILVKPLSFCRETTGMVAHA